MIMIIKNIILISIISILMPWTFSKNETIQKECVCYTPTKGDMSFIKRMKKKGHKGCSITINGQQTWVAFKKPIDEY